MKKKYYGILLAAVIAAGTMGVTAQAAELADTEKLTETANVTDDVNTANSTDASVLSQAAEELKQAATGTEPDIHQKFLTGRTEILFHVYTGRNRILLC